MNTKLAGIAIITLLISIIAVLGYQLYGAPKTGYVTTGSGLYQGYSSYEEMMQAHHGSQQQEPGCGMDSGPSVSEFATGELTDYDVTLDNSGYKQLLNYATTIKLSSGQQNKIIGLDIQLPCCGFQKIQATDNCACGHHIALIGLAKLLASNDYDSSKIQQEINVWKNIFYPDGVENGAGACG